MQRRWIRLGSRCVTAEFPHALAGWFDGLEKANAKQPDSGTWVRIVAGGDSRRFRVSAAEGGSTGELDLGDALATFWERVAFLLVDELADALALHAAALSKDNGLILLPGSTGNGKTRLALWYRRLGFDLHTDEVFSAAIACEQPDRLLPATLPRPVIVKDVTDARHLLRDGERAMQQTSGSGLLVKLDSKRLPPDKALDRVLIVFPKFTAGAPVSLTPLTTAHSGLHLLGNCVNVRNLASGGLALAGALARRAQAVSLEYGHTEQLHGTLDVLTDHYFSAQPSSEAFATLCTVLSATAARRPAVDASPESTREGAKPQDNAVASPTVKRSARRLTVGMATYDDYDGVYFTIQSLRMHNPDVADALEFVVIDNNPGGRCSEALQHLGTSIDGYRCVPYGEWSGTAVRNRVFAEASCRNVLCVDSHVLIAPGALSRLLAYLDANPDGRDLLQGPLVDDDLRHILTHFEPRWSDGMYGVWATDPRGIDPLAPPFDIPMQGLGLFACRQDAWPGFNPNFRGFGGEEGYIHEKTRQRGGRTLCLPFLRWVHRFERPLGIPYRNCWEDRINNYFAGFTELGLDTAEMEAHFSELLGPETADRIFAEIKVKYQPVSASTDPSGRQTHRSRGPRQAEQPAASRSDGIRRNTADRRAKAEQRRTISANGVMATRDSVHINRALD